MTVLEYLPAQVDSEPTSLVAVTDQCDAIDRWAGQTTSVGELRDAGNRLSAIDQYLARTSSEGRARVAATMRRLEVRIGELLGPPPDPSQSTRTDLSSTNDGLSRNQRHEFRRMAANPDAVEDTIAASTDEEPASRRKVMDKIKGSPPPPPVEGTAPRRKALTDQFFDATYDLGKAAERVARLVEDDRFPRNAEQVAARNRNDLIRTNDLLQEVITRLNSIEDTNDR